MPIFRGNADTGCHTTEGAPRTESTPLVPLLFFEFFEPLPHVFDGLFQSVLALYDVHGLLKAYDECGDEVSVRSSFLLSDS